MKTNLTATLGSAAVFWTTKGKLVAASLFYSSLFCSSLFCSSLFCLSLAAPGVARAASAGLPTVDISTTCRESEKAIITILGPGTQQTFDSCMKQEKDAREQIIKNWSNFPAGGRQRCVNTTGYMPSYVEWLTCLEMEQSVNELRKNERGTNRPATTEGRSER